MKIETKFNVGDIVYYVSGNNIKKEKVEKITITIENEKCKDNINIVYKLDISGSSFIQNALFKDFEEFKDFFQLKFEGTKQNK